MNKSELVEALSKETGLTSAKAGDALNALIGIITEAVTKGQTMQVTGFGSFSYTKRAARKGRNPSTGEAIKIAASKSVRFSVGQTFKNAVNKKKA
jgi:DNA-binding protein HU-beta